MLTEGEVYVTIKSTLEREKWINIGGEPPDGTNKLIRVELKDTEHKGKGSKGSKKIDLISFKNGFFLLNELKAKYSYSDVKKLREITESEKWRKAFIKALNEKKILSRYSLKINFNDYTAKSDYLIKAITYSSGNVIPPDFVVFKVTNKGTEIHFGRDIDQNIKELFIESFEI